MWTSIKEHYREIVIVLIGLLLRLPYLNGSFWLDEAAQAIESSRPLSQQLNISFDFQPPLLHLMTHFALYGGSSEWWLRTVGALIPGLITIWFTMKLGKKLANQHIGLIAGLLLATNPFHIFYSQELRPYALAGMFGTVSWWYLLKWFDAAQDQSKNRSQLTYIILTLLGLYSTYLYPFLIFAQILLVLVRFRKNIWEYIAGIATVCVGFIPIAPLFFSQLSVGTSLRSQLPGWESVVSLSQATSIPLTLGKFLFGLMDLDISLAFITPVVMLLTALTYLLISQSTRDKYTENSTTKFLLLWLLAPIILSWIVSFWVPVVRPKRLLFLLPAWLLLASSLAVPLYQKYIGVLLPKSSKDEELYKRTHFAAAWIVMAVLIGAQLVGLMNHFTNPLIRREDWRGAYQTITATYPAENSVALFSFTEPFAPWNWYDTLNYPALSTGGYSVEQIPDLETRLKGVIEYEHILVFDYLRDLTDPNNRIDRLLQELGYEERTTLDFKQIGFVRVYTRDSTVIGSK